MNNFIESISEILEVDSVTYTDQLNSFDSWSSLTVLSIIAYSDENFNVVLSADQINSCSTIGDLKALLSSKVEV